MLPLTGTTRLSRVATRVEDGEREVEDRDGASRRLTVPGEAGGLRSRSIAIKKVDS